MPKRKEKDVSLPSETEVIESLQWLANKEPTPEPRTFIMKVRNPSRQTKIPRLLNVHVYVTNLKDRVLTHYRESPDQQRDDGAIAMVLRVQHLGTGRARKLATLISSEYLVSNLTDEDLLYPARLRDGVCREVASMLINWVQDITGTLLSKNPLNGKAETEAEAKLDAEEQTELAADDSPEPVKPSQTVYKRSGKGRKSRKKRGTPMTLEQAYATWQQQRLRWERAAHTPIPFGKYSGTPLIDIGRREVRWLMERLLPVDEIKKTLEFIEHLIEYPLTLSQDAVYEKHPYLRDGGFAFKHRRAVRAHRLAQRVLDPRGDLVLLGMLHKDELQKLRNELQQLKKAGEQFDSLLPSLQEGLREAQQLAEFSDFEDSTFRSFQDVFETVLFEKPPDYPEVPRADLSDKHRQELHDRFGAALRWFQPNPKIPGDVTKYVDEKHEIRASQKLLRVQGQLTLPKLQPVPFLGTMQPARYSEEKGCMLSATNRDFALLIDRDTGEYVAAVWLRGRNDPVTPAEQAERQQKQAQQKHAGRLYYANFPETPFDPSDRSSHMLLPLEWGEQSHRRRFREKRQMLLTELIELQRMRQHQRHAKLSTPERPLPIVVCLPEETIFQGGRLMMNWDEQGNPEFFLSIKVALPIAQPAQIRQTIMGFHEHAEGYSFAELHVDGSVIRTGDLTIPNHVDPAHGAKRSANYIYEVVHAMLREAGTAYIGIEDTRYKKNAVRLDRHRNRMVFERPSGRICTTLVTKGKEVGVLPPRIVADVAPSRDCSNCRVRHPVGTSCYELRRMIQCPNPACQKRQVWVWDANSTDQHCGACGHAWSVTSDEVHTELYFVCPDCQQIALPARYNAAIVVAQQTLRELKQHWQNGIAYEERQEHKRVSKL